MSRMMAVLVAGLCCSTSESLAFFSEPEPQAPVLVDQSNFPKLLSGSAYATYLAETCSKGSSVRTSFSDLVDQLTGSQSSRDNILQEFVRKRNAYLANSGMLDVARLCYLNSAATNAKIADTEDWIRRYRNWADEKKGAFLTAHSAWADRKKQYESYERSERARQIAGENALAVVRQNGSKILGAAYPLAFGKLQYQSAEPLGMSKSGSDFVATVRLSYLNLLNIRNSMDVAFVYDGDGNYKSWSIVDFTDIIAPNKLTFESLLQMAGRVASE